MDPRREKQTHLGSWKHREGIPISPTQERKIGRTGNGLSLGRNERLASSSWLGSGGVQPILLHNRVSETISCRLRCPPTKRGMPLDSSRAKVLITPLCSLEGLGRY